MHIITAAAWGFIPARGGSKSIPLKNLAFFGGRPLLDYGLLAAKAWSGFARLFCSTDSPEIAARARLLGAEVHHRPADLAGDDTPIYEVVAHFLHDLEEEEGQVAEIIALLQPTSPFLLPEHIEGCVGGLRANLAAGSAQTVVPCPHNAHAYNQRVVEDGKVRFRFPEERRLAYNKQTKPKHYLFGNLLAFRSEAILAQGTLFAEPSLAVPISRPYDFDADDAADFLLGGLILAQGLVRLPHLPPA
ncbi:MAG: acylneuraminate cytidylyltransferase family protein [Deltaproteobacteria bacterium]|nr:MAG: acylneuraminate cytidylyltransferase family protein [Deltaproteobacteria bacterium]